MFPWKHKRLLVHALSSYQMSLHGGYITRGKCGFDFHVELYGRGNNGVISSLVNEPTIR